MTHVSDNKPPQVVHNLSHKLGSITSKYALLQLLGVEMWLILVLQTR